MKYFVVSDIHSYYEPLMQALNEAGFDETDSAHKLIICGDLLDRGPDSIKCISFINRLIDNDKAICIKGNHEILLQECCFRGFAYSYDKSNGTVRTILDLGGYADSHDFSISCENTIKAVRKYISSLVNFYETKHYIFVHGWIPAKEFFVQNQLSRPQYEYIEDWRNCDDEMWDECATWYNGMSMCDLFNIREPGKVIVCGHYHTSWGHANLDHKCSEFGVDADFSPYRSKGIIAIDGCVHYTGKVNCIIIDDEELDN